MLSGKTVLLPSYTLCRACKLAFVPKGTASTRLVLIVTFGVLRDKAVFIALGTSLVLSKLSIKNPHNAPTLNENASEKVGTSRMTTEMQGHNRNEEKPGVKGTCAVSENRTGYVTLLFFSWMNLEILKPLTFRDISFPLSQPGYICRKNQRIGKINCAIQPFLLLPRVSSARFSLGYCCFPGHS